MKNRHHARKASIISDSPAARHRAKMQAAGLVQVSAWIPAASASDFYVAAAAMRLDPPLTIGPLKNVVTGRFCKS